MQSPETETAHPQPAASVIVLRPGAAGFEVLLMERASQASNFAGALVFPGGKVEAGDDAIALQSGFAQIWPELAPRLQDLPGHNPQTHKTDDGMHAMASLYGAALRETLEEVGLVCHIPNASAQALAAARAQLAQSLDWAQAMQALHSTSQATTQATKKSETPPVHSLHAFSRWITPRLPNMSVRRFDTWFFLAELPAGQQAQADGGEAQRLVWATPRQLLADYARGDILLAPPQIMTLAHLARFADITSLTAFARARALCAIEPLSTDQDGQRMVCFPGDPLHSLSGARIPGPTRLLARGKHGSGVRFEPEGGFDSLFS